jgi:cytochrome c556
MKRTVCGIAGLVALGMIAACSGGGSEASVENPRTAKFKAIAKANKAIGEELKKDGPAIDTIATNARALDDLAKELPGWFPGTSGPEAGMKSEAKSEIWQKPAEFKAAADKFAAATALLQAAAASGDIAQVKAASAGVGPTCKGCHETFRAKD